MSDIKNTQLYKNIVNSKNLYMAIYSVESYVYHPNLLGKEDFTVFCKLKDKFNHKYIDKVMRKVKQKIEKIMLEDEFFKVSVFFKPKKYNHENNHIESRPLHTSDIYTQIAIVAMLNPIIYDFNELKTTQNLSLSNLSKLIPNNFYGNIPSLNPERLFKSWKEMYKEYSQDITDSYSRYLETGEYNYEITLDLVNFFPSIDPYLIYKYVLNKLSVRFQNKEYECLKIVLYKLLYFKVNNIEKNEKVKKEYYSFYNNTIDNLKSNFSVGIVQGLPQAYFWGNICMINVAKKFEKNLMVNRFIMLMIQLFMLILKKI